MAVEDKNIHPWKKRTMEDMEFEIESLSFYDEGEEFPKEDVVKSLEQLNVKDSAGYRYDRARDAEQ